MALDPDFEAKIREAANKYISENREAESYYRNIEGSAAYGAYKGAGNNIDAINAGLGDFLSRVEAGGLSMDNMDSINKAIRGAFATNNVDVQALNELIDSNIQRTKSNQQLTDYRNRAETQLFGGAGRTLQQALADPNSELGGLGEFLRNQQSDVFRSELRPMIESQLGAKGLLDSGANVELQAKALGGLERDRQSRLMDAGLRAKEGVRSLERSDILGDIGSQQSALSNMFDLQRQGLTMAWEENLMAKRDQLARELSSISNSGPSELQQILGGIGMAGSIGAAPFTGGTSLAALPAFTGMTFGGGGSQAGMGASQLGMSFFNSGGGGGSYGGSRYNSGGSYPIGQNLYGQR